MVKKNKRITKNKSLIGCERSHEAKEIENIFNKLQSYIPNYESNLNQQKPIKSFKGFNKISNKYQ